MAAMREGGSEWANAIEALERIRWRKLKSSFNYKNSFKRIQLNRKTFIQLNEYFFFFIFIFSVILELWWNWNVCVCVSLSVFDSLRHMVIVDCAFGLQLNAFNQTCICTRRSKTVFFSSSLENFCFYSSFLSPRMANPQSKSRFEQIRNAKGY